MPFADLDGLRIYYHTAGDVTARRGQRVLYVHGTGCNGRVWLQHMQAIAAVHTPVAIDLPGHGQSAGRGFRGAADYGHVVAALARHLGWERCVVVGHSLGGAVALTVAVYESELLSGLVLVDTGARLRVHPDILRAARQAAASGQALPLDRAWAYAPTTPQTVVDAVHALTADTDPRVTYADWICDDSFDFMARLKDIHVPALAVCGAEDRLTPVHYHRYLQRHLPRCQLAVLRHAGHWSFVEQPALFNQVLLAFLSELPAA
ncbi:MAG: alpha/beta hydrolase [Candidatus Tectimicrobiota bacterium]|nr:MAG: alpha/beta hydrolase [Candidatus Tectomicrobia bacterium]